MTIPSNIDVIVIGSGFGGSITANRLARAGQQVLVLERGPWRDTLPVRSMGVERTAPLPYGRQAYTHLLHSFRVGRWGLNLSKFGLFELQSHKGLRVMCASSVGGGSIAYGGLLEPPRDPGYWQARHPELDPGSIEQHYGTIMNEMGAVDFDRDSCIPQSVWGLLPKNAGSRCQPTAQQPRIAMLVPETAEQAGQILNLEHGLKRQYCAFDGDSFLGSRGGAKASVDFIYLAPVLGQGANVRDLCEVTGIRRVPEAEGGGYAVDFKDLAAKRRERVRARRVVLAAGTLNTLRLLFSSQTRGDLSAMPALGQTFGANGDLMGLLSGMDNRLSSFTAPALLGTFSVDGYDKPLFGVGGLAGVDSIPMPERVKDWLSRTYLMYGMGADSGSGSVGFRKGRLRIEYDQGREPIYDEIKSAFGVLAAETGGKTWTLGKPLTVHPWGGACLGPDPSLGVVDHRGEVYGNPGLFVADGAALPAAPGGPPSLTIGAWAHHVADSIADAERDATPFRSVQRNLFMNVRNQQRRQPNAQN